MRAEAPAARVEASPEAVEVEADSQELRKALANLVRNARQAAGDGPVVVAFRRAKGAVAIEVRDGGPGVPPGDRERIFDHFVSGRAGTGSGSPSPARGGGAARRAHPRGRRAGGRRAVHAHHPGGARDMNEKAVVLVVEDDPGQREQLAGFLDSIGVETRVAADAASARAVLGTESVDVVVTDLRLPGESGLELLAAARRANPLVDFIVVTAYGSVGNAVEAMRSGAHDFLEKPVDLDVLELGSGGSSSGAASPGKCANSASGCASGSKSRTSSRNSEGMQEVLSVVRRVAPTDSTILLTGESGTGKERIAELIHGESRRRDRPFIRVNCAAMPETLLETECFGHVRGAFTGAHQDRIGRFEEANGGTLLLDEIGDLSAATQAKLLRALQEREIVRVGENRARRVDVRIIAATNKNLTEEKQAGRFREDLLYRIEVIAIRIPPLRERRPDTVELIQRLLARYSREVGRGPRRISREAHDLLIAYPWPGNVRELQNVLQRAVILAPGEQIRMEDLPEQVRHPPEPEDRAEPLGERTLPEMVEELERRALARALAAEGGVKARAARRLGLPERVLRYKMAKYGL